MSIVASSSVVRPAHGGAGRVSSLVAIGRVSFATGCCNTRPTRAHLRAGANPRSGAHRAVRCAAADPSPAHGRDGHVLLTTMAPLGGGRVGIRGPRRAR